MVHMANKPLHLSSQDVIGTVFSQESREIAQISKFYTTGYSSSYSLYPLKNALATFHRGRLDPSVCLLQFAQVAPAFVS